MNAFKAYDIRGVYRRDFDKNHVYRIGFFLPQLLKTQKILVGRDCRESSPEIFQALAQGITDSGANVANIGIATTPMLYFATAKFGFHGSAMITASHNPKEYNGLKISKTNALPVGYDTGLRELEKLVKNQKPSPAKQKGSIEKFEVRDAYIQFLSQYATDFSDLKIAVDCSNGMAGLLAREVLGESPLFINETPDGTFPNHDANPLEEENLKDLQKTVAENACDIGVIFDGDGDRVAFVDENGLFIPPDLMIAFLGHYFFAERQEKGKVLQDIRSSKAVGEYLAQFDAPMHTWRVGRAYAAHKLREIDGIYGGELAGHYYFRDFFYSDSGLLACLLILRVANRFKQQGISISQAIAKIKTYQNSGEINFRLRQKHEAMLAVKQHFESKQKPQAFFDFDGYRLEYPDWWFNIRPSNTEPYLRLIVEAANFALLQEKTQEIRQIIDQFD